MATTSHFYGDSNSRFLMMQSALAAAAGARSGRERAQICAVMSHAAPASPGWHSDGRVAPQGDTHQRTKNQKLMATSHPVGFLKMAFNQVCLSR